MITRLFVALVLVGGCSAEGVRVAAAPDASAAALRGPDALSVVDVGADAQPTPIADAQPTPIVAPDAGAAASDVLVVVAADALPPATDVLPAATPDVLAPTPDALAPAPDALATPDLLTADLLTTDTLEAGNGPIDPPADCPLLQVRTGAMQGDFCEGFWPSAPPLLCAISCQTLDSLHPRMTYNDPAKGCYSQWVMSEGQTSFVICLPSADLCATYCPKK
jgi:hypothetical protein